ncbi:CxC2 domain-containing protein [Mycena indigotica]|uniref:CxC2 domain-containing protein n=1 Tax=Mycena indigotica TaxID=2126181 RepID=A0A8H6T3I4_9AGAR|nr:CxC2 domain-containing protein [Mycena indigotica]KAF7310200.1 CxC2 domain-containing protein [Mycena indigotica]
MATRAQLTEDLAEWMPFTELADDELAAIAQTISSEPQPLDDDHTSGKRKRIASEDPMALWRRMSGAYLDELLRGESLGRHHGRPSCAACGEILTENAESRAFRCVDCGPFLQCEECLRNRHEQLPLHSVQVRERLNYCYSGLILSSRRSGPDSGANVPFSVRPSHKQALVSAWCTNWDTTDFHAHIPTRDCEGWLFSMLEAFSKSISDFARAVTVCVISICTLSQLLDNAWYPATTIEPATCATFRVLDLFRTLKVVGNMNAHDFVGSLERLSNATFTEQLPDRYKAFGRMSRQYDFLMRAKRAGRGHAMDGLATTPAGGLAVRCWACPDPERNLPDGWENADPSKSYIYSLMLALDANFRLKNRLRANERQDPALGNGLGYFVETNEYKEHLRHYVAEEDVSTCIAFAALMQKETRLTTGLRVSGVGGCVCARHGIVRPLGLGDLQKGERYANMDWVFLNAVGGLGVRRLVISYDIACQWKQRIRERATKLSKNSVIVTKLDDYALQFALPVWHAVAHESSCQAANSLTHAVGVGRTDGEGIERTWAILNPIGFSTKEMGEGNRHDTIEDKIDHVNFEKNVKQGNTLARKMLIALAERETQINEFAEVDDSLESSLREQWQRQVNAWNADNTSPNPYVSTAKHAGPSEAQILAELKKAELEQLRSGRGNELAAGRTTAAAFIKGALQLEDQQRRIRFESSGQTTLTAERSSQLDELRVSVLKKLHTLQMHQMVFMPGVEELRAAEEERRDVDAAPAPAEVAKLWLPSDLSMEQREAVCRPTDTLAKIRGHLHAKTHLIDTRNANAVGQNSSTRFGTLIGRVGDQARRQATKYREARAALVRLKGPEFAPQFRELHDDDLRVHIESESDAQARAALGKLGSSKRARNEPSLTKKVVPVSWIWFAGGEANKEELHDSVRVQWTKSLARRDRWIEEVHLLREEMRRVIKSIEVDEELAAGLMAYAKRQSFVYGEVEKAFRGIWSASTVAAIRAAADNSAEPMTSAADTAELTHGPL